MLGTVKSFKTKNGCGFIRGEDLEDDVFVHVSNIVDNEGVPADILVPGETVEYDLYDGRRGRAACNVRRVSPPILLQFTGKVKKYLSKEGYGFIEHEGGDVFFHCADLLAPTVAPGDSVTYLKADVHGKSRALRVERKSNV